MIGGKEHFLILEALKRYFGTFYCILCMLLLKNAFIEKTEKNRKGYFSFLFKKGVLCPVPSPAPAPCIISLLLVNACYRVYVYFFTSLLFAKIFLQMTHICINFPGFFNVFLEGVYTWNFIPDEIRPGWNHTCLWWNVSYCLHVFAEMRFHPGMKKKKKKRRVNTSSRDEILKCACFSVIFDVRIQICFPKLTYLNIMTVWMNET